MSVLQFHFERCVRKRFKYLAFNLYARFFRHLNYVLPIDRGPVRQYLRTCFQYYYSVFEMR